MYVMRPRRDLLAGTFVAKLRLVDAVQSVPNETG